MICVGRMGVERREMLMERREKDKIRERYGEMGKK
jgi:hypothetical protein